MAFPRGFQWDEAKNHANMRTHGIDFRDAVRVFAGPMLSRLDDRRNYSEVRVNSLGEMGEQVVVNVTHTSRGGDIRLISVRQATRRERALYEEFRRSLGKEAETGR